VRHEFELTFLEVSAKNKHLFFFQILTGAKYNFSSYGSEGANRSTGIIFRFFADGFLTYRRLAESLRTMNRTSSEEEILEWFNQGEGKKIQTGSAMM